MANDLNRTMLVGRLVKDPELRYTQGGTSVASFSIANNRSYTKGGEKSDQVSYFECIAWGKLGELISQYCKKGKLIGLDGRLQQRSWDNKEGQRMYKIEVVVENFQFLSPPDGATQGSKPAQQTEPTQQGLPMDSPFNDDDIPF